MGGLSHYLERSGLPTTQISLIRLHTEKIRPPRALWVPFELGRPLGAPGDPALQRRVLLAALALLAAPAGPVLKDFPEEAPTAAAEPGVWACPISLPQAEEDLDQAGRLRQAFVREVAQMSTWYQEALQQRGRTTYGVSGLGPLAVADFLASLLEGRAPDNPRPGLSLPGLAKLASEDLKAFYLEAVTAQPGGETDSARLTDWFFGQTVAGRVLLRLRGVLAASDDPEARMVGKLLMVPVSQAARKARG
ncbi:MAG: hypothetical protein C4525_02600 [Desulfarculus sp.]|nr:MAG: hypothetical protein C4525_02600 [Desulfarculus sp.]